jgi:hypothetical protein
MKRGTFQHPKLLALARELEIPPYCALGLLDVLLDWTFSYARQGDVGRYDNQAIANGVGWQGDPDRLIAALVATRWLDRSRTHRLVVHDLADHASESWKRIMRRQGLDFARPDGRPVDKCPDIVRSMSGQVPTLSGQVPTLSGQVPTLSGPSASASASASAPASASLASLAPVFAPGFDDFWQRYPLHVGKQAARRAWGKLGPSPPLGQIVDALAWQRESPRWREDGGRYVPHPATYLNGRRWEDERPPLTALERFAAEGETG